MNVDKLIKKSKKGNKEALLELIMLEKDSYYRLSLSYMKNEDDAMNCLQDMIVRLYENINKLNDSKKFYSWSKTILVNLCKDELKKRKKVVSIDDYEKFKLEFHEDKDIDLNIDEILSKVDAIYSEPIKLKYILGYDYESIAEILNIPVGTVKSRIYNGKSKLELVLKEGEKDAR